MQCQLSVINEKQGTTEQPKSCVQMSLQAACQCTDLEVATGGVDVVQVRQNAALGRRAVCWVTHMLHDTYQPATT